MPTCKHSKPGQTPSESRSRFPFCFPFRKVGFFFVLGSRQRFSASVNKVVYKEVEVTQPDKFQARIVAAEYNNPQKKIQFESLLVEMDYRGSQNELTNDTKRSQNNVPPITLPKKLSGIAGRTTVSKIDHPRTDKKKGKVGPSAGAGA